MKKKFIQFFLRLTILSSILLALVIILKLILPAGIISPVLPYLFLLLYPVTGLVHYILLRITTLNPRRFAGYFMLATFLKLALYLAVMVIFVIALQEGLLPFVLGFFILYIIYTIFEVAQIIAQTRDPGAS